MGDDELQYRDFRELFSPWMWQKTRMVEEVNMVCQSLQQMRETNQALLVPIDKQECRIIQSMTQVRLKGRLAEENQELYGAGAAVRRWGRPDLDHIIDGLQENEQPSLERPTGKVRSSVGDLVFSQGNKATCSKQLRLQGSLLIIRYQLQRTQWKHFNLWNRSSILEKILGKESISVSQPHFLIYSLLKISEIDLYIC